MSPEAEGKSIAILAVDTGGTFTDVLLLSEGALTTLKIPSTPENPAEAVLLGEERVAPGPQAGPGARRAPGGIPFDLVHGSTVATNALLERTGARVVLVTNRGFEDILEIGRQNRPQLYALVGRRAPPLVDREARLGIAGRIDATGAELEPLDPVELEALAKRVGDAEAEAVVVALLHAYANPAHEVAVGRALGALDVPVALSSAILPEYREYERISTTVVNAYVAPIMSRYLGQLADDSRARRIRIMGSSGGALPVERAVREPVHTVLSGPAGGVVGALEWARRVGVEQIISFDMGGTSTDVSLCPGAPMETRELSIAGQPVAIPVLDIHTVGAGGGSLARVDAGGALRVGPESAGADPGPISYGRGGEGVTVTDAHVWLGRLPPNAFLGGQQELEREAVGPPLRALASRMNVSLVEAAQGVLEVANAAMERALRVISVERGYDPADFTVVAFGGAGGLHVAELVERLGAARAIIPPDPGLLSAYGMLVAPVTRSASRTVLWSTRDPNLDTRVQGCLAELRADVLAQMAEEGHPQEALGTDAWIDARYRGQSFELRVPAHDWKNAFHAMHRERYGYDRSDAVVEAVTLRVTAHAPTPRVELPTLPTATAAPVGETKPILDGEGTVTATAYWRRDLKAGHTLTGPALIQEYSSTTWLPAGWRLDVHLTGCLLLSPPA